MVLRPEKIIEQLKELDEILSELNKHRNVSWHKFRTDLSQRWIIERRLIAAASVIFDIANTLVRRFQARLEDYGPKELVDA
jgi:uncharacterized protein YutE (UPF0331/DUF86 family)